MCLRVGKREKGKGGWESGAKTGAKKERARDGGGFAERSAKSYTKFIISRRYNVCRDSAEV
jgi:hypothetical protein